MRGITETIIMGWDGYVGWQKLLRFHIVGRRLRRFEKRERWCHWLDSVLRDVPRTSGKRGRDVRLPRLVGRSNTCGAGRGELSGAGPPRCAFHHLPVEARVSWPGEPGTRRKTHQPYNNIMFGNLLILIRIISYQACLLRQYKCTKKKSRHYNSVFHDPFTIKMPINKFVPASQANSECVSGNAAIFLSKQPG